MSATDPYIVGANTPSEIKRFLGRFPQAIRIVKNIREDKSLSNRVYFENVTQMDDDDPMGMWVTDQLIELELVKKSKDTTCGYEVTVGPIVVEKGSLSKSERRDYAIACLRETEAAVKNNAERDLLAGNMKGSLAKEDFDSMMREVLAVFDKYKDKPDGAYNYLINFVSQEV